MSRQDERTITLQLTFSYLVNPEMNFESTLDLIGQSSEYSTKIFLGIKRNITEYFEIIQPHLKGWSIARVSPMEKALLLVAIEEIKNQPDVPFKVAIDEALRLNNIYGDTEASGFINAILDKMKQ